MMSTRPMPCPVAPAQLSQVVGYRCQVPQDQLDVVCALGSVTHAFRNELQLLCYPLGQIVDVA